MQKNKPVQNLKNKEQLIQVAGLANKDFDLDINGLTVSDYPEFLKLLSSAVQNLIDSDFERFLNALYRIDVDENKVKQAFAAETNVAEAIAELIIQREVQKIETRDKYKT